MDIEEIDEDDDQFTDDENPYPDGGDGDRQGADAMSQEVFQRDHDRTVTQRPHTFTCKHCLETFTIMQYPAPSRIVCDECKTNEAAKQAKRDYMREYMAATRKAKAEFQEPKRRGRPPRA